MDKYEYRVKTEQMLEYMKEKSYKQAMEIAESIDWKRVKNVPMLCTVSEIYEYNREYQKSRDVLFMAYDRAPESRKIIYRLGVLALKLDDYKEAQDCYKEFVEIAPKDPNAFIFKYKLLQYQKAPIEQQIEALVEFKKAEYVEKWAFELARLYNEAGMTAECLDECDDLILWFSEGRYVRKAMELKMQYKPLTPLQQEKYEHCLKKEAESKIVEEEDEPVAEEEKKQHTSSMSVEEILRGWEQTQKEHAQIIMAERERIQLEQELQVDTQVEEEIEEEELLPEDVKQLMEELEAESAEIAAQKAAPEEVEESEKKSLLEKVVETLGAMEHKEDVLPENWTEVPVEETEPQMTEESVLTQKTVRFDLPVQEEMLAAVAEAISVEEPVEDEVETLDEGVRVGDTQSMANVAKALQRDRVVETPEESRPVRRTATSKFDTGFVVQGRYDLEAQSEIGLKAGLTEEQKHLFSYFVPVRGVSEQIVEVLHQEQACKARYGTSRIGNLVIVGRKGAGKTVLAVNFVKAIQKSRNLKQGKVGIVTAESLNKKDLSVIMEKLQGGALIIERASRMNRKTVSRLSDIMEGQTGEMLVILEDERKPMDKMLSVHPNFNKKFTARVELPVFINDELVTFGQTYAKENGYKIDDMGILALYTRIDVLQREESVVTVADVKELVDAAIENSKKLRMKNLVQKLFKKKTDDSERVILSEKDFKE